jgi:hypothetical protein
MTKHYIKTDHITFVVKHEKTKCCLPITATVERDGSVYVIVNSKKFSYHKYTYHPKDDIFKDDFTKKADGKVLWNGTTSYRRVISNDYRGVEILIHPSALYREDDLPEKYPRFIIKIGEYFILKFYLNQDNIPILNTERIEKLANIEDLIKNALKKEGVEESFFGNLILEKNTDNIKRTIYFGNKTT